MKMDELVAGYIALRDKIAEEEEAFKKKMQDKKAVLEKIEAKFKEHFDTTGTDTLSVRGVGTAFKKVTVSTSVADWDAAWGYIQQREAWDMLEHRVSKTAVMARLKEEGELPPGINMSQRVEVQVRRS